jgi:hypothetical protein
VYNGTLNKHIYHMYDISCVQTGLDLCWIIQTVFQVTHILTVDAGGWGTQQSYTWKITSFNNGDWAQWKVTRCSIRVSNFENFVLPLSHELTRIIVLSCKWNFKITLLDIFFAVNVCFVNRRPVKVLHIFWFCPLHTHTQQGWINMDVGKITDIKISHSPREALFIKLGKF